MPATSAIIASHNGWHYLQRCLPKLLDQSLPFRSIVVIDNGSTDHTRNLLSRQFPTIELLPLDHNYGYSGAMNHGLLHILKQNSFAYVALVNNDVYLDPDWHLNTYQALAADAQLGSCATCLLKEQSPEIVDSAGIIWSKIGRADNYLSGNTAPSANEPVREILGASGAAALYRTLVFEEIGLFDPSLFAYQEDVDLALRCQTAGWKCAFIPGARGLHTGHGTNRNFPISGTYADYYNSRNRLAVLVASLPDKEWRLHWRSIIMNECVNLYASFGEGRFVATLCGLLRGYLRLPALLLRRLQTRKDNL